MEDLDGERPRLSREVTVHETIEDNLNAVRDQLAATTIELQQREDEQEIRCREIDDMIVEHRRQLQAVDEGWRGEVEETKAHADDLRDVRVMLFLMFALN